MYLSTKNIFDCEYTFNRQQNSIKIVKIKLYNTRKIILIDF